MEEITFYATL